MQRYLIKTYFVPFVISCCLLAITGNYGHNPVQSVVNTQGLIINDLDGGPDFFPARSDGKKEVDSLVQPIDLFLQKKNAHNFF
jgi:hypothetical protein